MTDEKCIVWDFDGVLNANVVDGRFLWGDSFEEDTGQSHEAFQREIFDYAGLKARLNLR